MYINCITVLEWLCENNRCLELKAQKETKPTIQRVWKLGHQDNRMLASHRVIQCSNEKTSKDMNGNESKGSVRSGLQECATLRGSCKGQSILLYASVLIPSLW